MASVKNAQVIQYEMYCFGCLVWFDGGFNKRMNVIYFLLYKGVGCHLFEREGYIVDS